jgi:hypothetical protein
MTQNELIAKSAQFVSHVAKLELRNRERSRTSCQIWFGCTEDEAEAIMDQCWSLVQELEDASYALAGQND